MKKLIKIQSELKAPKNQFNTFGKYKYRSCEDILEAVKPLLAANGCTLVITDEVKEVCGVIYAEATCIFSDGDSTIQTKAQAGIDVNKKGMDTSQTFGSSSSYARKYALNGLFLIDDTKDADTQNPTQKVAKKEELTPNHPKWKGAKDAIENGTTTIDAILKYYTLSQKNKELLCS